jgi:hypothetical protein
VRSAAAAVQAANKPLFSFFSFISIYASNALDYTSSGGLIISMMLLEKPNHADLLSLSIIHNFWFLLATGKWEY